MVQDQADDEEELSSEEERDKQSGSTIRQGNEELIVLGRKNLINEQCGIWQIF